MSYRFNLGSAYRAHCERCGCESIFVRGACCHHTTTPARPSWVNAPISRDYLRFNNQSSEAQAARNRRRAMAGMRAAK